MTSDIHVYQSRNLHKRRTVLVSTQFQIAENHQVTRWQLHNKDPHSALALQQPRQQRPDWPVTLGRQCHQICNQISSSPHHSLTVDWGELCLLTQQNPGIQWQLPEGADFPTCNVRAQSPPYGLSRTSSGYRKAAEASQGLVDQPHHCVLDRLSGHSREMPTPWRERGRTSEHEVVPDLTLLDLFTASKRKALATSIVRYRVHLASSQFFSTICMLTSIGGENERTNTYVINFY